MRALWWSPLAVLLLATGCPTSDNGTEPETDTDTDTDTDSDADTDTDTDTDTEPDPRTNVTGTIFDQTGAPYAGAQIRFCRGLLCLNGESDSAGQFHFDQVQAFNHSFEVLVPTDPTRATGFTVVELTEDVPKSLTMHLPLLDTASPLGSTAEWHAVGTGLRVQLAEAELVAPDFFPEATEVAGVRVDPSIWPQLDGLTGAHAVWFLEPFDYHAPPAGIPFEIDNDMGLTAGGTYEVYVGDYTSSEWLFAGTVTESGGVLSGATAGLPLMSTVVLTDPQSTN